MSPAARAVLPTVLELVLELVDGIRNREDAEALVAKLRALGPARRADLDRVREDFPERPPPDPDEPVALMDPWAEPDDEED